MYHIKKIKLTPDLKISEVVQENPYFLLFFEHFGITLPVNDKTIETVCTENSISTDLVISFANLFNGVKLGTAPNPSVSDTKAIVQYLRNSHDFYSNEIYPEIRHTIKQLANVNHSSEMNLVEKFFQEYFDEVTEHLDYENNIVFPYVISLYEQIKKETSGKDSTKYSVIEYQEHHNDIEEKLEDLKKILIKYLPKSGDQVLRRKLLLSLFELEYDLNVHSQIEEYILIPLVEKMESHLNPA